MGRVGRPKKIKPDIGTLPEHNEPEEVVAAQVEKDPSYNCLPCKGEGMIFDLANTNGKICDQCRGTGKV